MKKLEERLAELRDAPSDKLVRDAIRSTTGALVAAAVKHADPEELAPAFARLCERGEKRDPGCRGKIAIARALVDGDRWDDAVFVPGVRTVQMEPQWGGPVDTAAELRGLCGIAFARAAHGHAMDVLAELLADPEPAARMCAAQGLGDSGRPDAAPLLRYKLLVGDERAEVLSAACESLLHLEKDAALELFARLLLRTDELAEVAALALGASKLAGAAPILVGWSERCMPEVRRRVGYLALALARTENQRLLDIVRDGEPADALAAARALATFKEDPAVRESLIAAAGRRREILALL